jgi:hypothetical protein
VARDGAGGDARWWLWWQLELQLLDQEPEFWLRLGVAGQQQLPPVGRRQMNIDHLVGRSVGGGRPKEAIAAAAKELGVSKKPAERSYAAESLPDDVKAAADEAGLAD